ncbi:MAG TPA: shikimate kinase [Acidimicrobiales bacterium]|nr:shikimate kinase [Acidimicrobiales bacterium]
MRRVSVVGNSGSGKTTLGRGLAAALGVPFVELDGLVHQPGWTELPTDEFRAAVRTVVAGDGWVVDGNYGRVRDLVWDRADTVVWLDLPRWRVMRQLVGRTLRRGVTRQELWNGNRESLRNFVRRNPEESIVVWAYTNHDRYRDRYAALSADPAHAGLRFVRLRSPAEVRAFLAGAAAATT